MNKNPRDIILSPVVSEKSYGLIDQGVYTFIVSESANKVEIRQAIESIFSVRVAKVNTINRDGKRKRDRRTGRWGVRASSKRAMVSLAPGYSIDVFEA
ncbi:MAG: 50S ribosomal protein L23 [Acidimicrobiia bacterium]|jgi:large subunit ribosomal protein L23|nr:50S ribosomal protein L23 [Acidimicrobiia bacterium]MBP8181000.1 50S ribosomal protein L23 [Acidimicrobiia bacterium]